jgi:predicted nucleotidyltransferase
MVTAREITPEQFASYREGARRRQEAERWALVAREERAWALARHVADLLRERFAIERVVVFGSLVHPGCFTPWSDVDIAVWGLRPEETFRAIGLAMDAAAQIAVNLVDVGACRASLLEVIEREGVGL